MRIAFQYYPLEQCPEYVITIPDDADIDYEIKRRLISPHILYCWRKVEDDKEYMIKEPPVRR